MKTSQPFYRRFRGQLLRAAGVTAVVGPLVCAACTSEVVIEGDGDGGGTTNATATNGSGGAGSVTSTSSSGQGGSSISVTVSTVNSGVGGSTPDDPGRNLTGDPFFTDGQRAVLFLSSEKIELEDVDFLEW